MKKLIIITISLAILIFLVKSIISLKKNEYKEFKELSQVFQSLNICLNIEEQAWNDSIKNNPELLQRWRFFCDTSYFKTYKIRRDIPLNELLLLEVRINQGSGEYDNFIIKKTSSGYKISCEFKGYLDSVLVEKKDYNRFIFKFNTTEESCCKVLGYFDGEEMVTDTILNFDIRECKDIFIKGKPFCE